MNRNGDAICICPEGATQRSPGQVPTCRDAALGSFLWIAMAALLVGCDSAQPPEFRLNMVEAVTQETAPEYQQEIADVLGAMFGTPDKPFAMPESGLDQSKLRLAAGPAWSDQRGYNFGLYRRHCVHCHGVTGDGRGPTARFLNPYPRDYRPGVYKFKSTFNPARPTDADLHTVLINGVPGTAMPSFSLLPNSEVEALVEYVKYLSYRGQMETELIKYVYDELGEEEAENENGEALVDEDGEPVMLRIPLDPANDAEQRETIVGILEEIVAGWDEANDQIIMPEVGDLPDDDRSAEEILASVEKGRKLFYGVRANCIKCHGPTALGDGQTDDHNNWQKAHKKFLEDTAAMAESLHRSENELPDQIEAIEAQEKEGQIDSAEAEEQIQELEDQLDGERQLYVSRFEVGETLYPLRNAMPRNLRQGIYRGGRRRVDVFWRIYTGIAGTPMPGSGPASPGAKGTLTEAEMWNIVDYVITLPYEAASQPQKALPKNIDEVL